MQYLLLSPLLLPNSNLILRNIIILHNKLLNLIHQISLNNNLLFPLNSLTNTSSSSKFIRQQFSSFFNIHIKSL